MQPSLIVSDSSLCAIIDEAAENNSSYRAFATVQDGYVQRDYDGAVAETSLYPLPVEPAWGKGFLRDGFRRHILGKPGAWQVFASICASIIRSGTVRGRSYPATSSDRSFCLYAQALVCAFEMRFCLACV